MLAISLTSTEWWDVSFFCPWFTKTQRIVVIFFKDLQESIFEKTLVSQLGEAEEDSQQGSVIFFFSPR